MLVRLFPLVLSSLSFFLLLIGPTLTKAPLGGRPCVANRTLGVYKPLKQCPSLLKKGFSSCSAPIVPGSDYSDSIICCINDAADNNIWSISTAPTPDSHAKAKAKCEEYSRLADTLSIPPTATIDEKPSSFLTRKVETHPKEFLHTAAIGFTSADSILFHCSGTVISKRFVLTAAHCTYDTYFGVPSTFWVRVGDLNLNNTDDDAGASLIRVIERIRHPLYNTSIGYHDIALLKLEKDIPFNEWVRPACLPYSLPDCATHKAIATRWGGIDWNSIGPPNVLIKVTMRLIPQLECNVSYKDVLPSGVIADWQICAGEKGSGACKGDGGGPLVIVNKDHPRMSSLIGITSMENDCGVNPGIYTRVYSYVPWIESIVWSGL